MMQLKDFIVLKYASGVLNVTVRLLLLNGGR